jgi:hypothetical protein
MARKKTPAPAKPTLAVVESVAPVGPSGDDFEADPDGLTVQEIAFVDALAGGGSLQDGATAAGISYRTAKRWHHKDHVAAAIRTRVSENFSQARAVLAAGASRAARQLDTLALSAEPDAARVSACKAVIENAVKLGELQEIEARLAELEARQGRQPGQPGFTSRKGTS